MVLILPRPGRPPAVYRLDNPEGVPLPMVDGPPPPPAVLAERLAVALDRAIALKRDEPAAGRDEVAGGLADWHAVRDEVTRADVALATALESAGKAGIRVGGRLYIRLGATVGVHEEGLPAATAIVELKDVERA